ncbi:protein ANTAGONIST OF LIKE HETEROCHROMATIN PROTEIN 1-like [Aphis craccivora]|uniref:Protein ANTAGONIST OF LIKE HETEROCHROMATIN PROTEIN 1-like n=1 Tax=Aphis craccivora TaxID=307492 RepID=A0A6G0XAI5_APHCR|nr:protein ANTAGONIST OF LIKE HETEROCHROMATIN PROTEIN 1-like [Aphis craccivora]
MFFGVVTLKNLIDFVENRIIIDFTFFRLLRCLRNSMHRRCTLIYSVLLNRISYCTPTFLATGENYRSLAFQFRISYSWISTIIKEVLVVICNRLKNIAMSEPTESSLTKVSNDFYEMWNFSNCCGAIDGKHIRIVCPDNSGSLYFNLKSLFFIVLLALVDANNKFLVIDIGSYRKEGDAGIFPKSNLGKSILTGEFKFPEAKCLPNTDIVLLM